MSKDEEVSMIYSGDPESVNTYLLSVCPRNFRRQRNITPIDTFKLWRQILTGPIPPSSLDLGAVYALGGILH